MPSNPKLRDDHGTSWDAATYARTSTEQQKSCSSQQDLCRRLIDDRGWRVRFKLQDEGERGQQRDRPAYQRLLELARDRRINVIVVWKLDRLFRSLKEASAAEEALRDSGVAIVSYTEPFDTTTPIGRFVFGFLANVAQFETELIKERALLGYERRVREGKWTGPIAPFGYRKDATGRLQVDEAEAEVLRLMHRHYGRIPGDSQLASWLTLRGHKWRGKEFTTERVRRALTNSVTCGDLVTRGIKYHHPHLAIITRRRFLATMSRRTALHHLGKQQSTAQRERGLDRVLNDYLKSLDHVDCFEAPSPGEDGGPSSIQ